MDVVIIDDSLRTRTLLASLLRDIGCHSVRPFENADEACVAIHNKRPTLVLCDWTMAAANGGVFLDRIRQDPDPGIAGTPIIIITGHASRDVLAAALHKGATQFLVKPVVPGELLKKMKFIVQDDRKMVSRNGRMVYVQPKTKPKVKKRNIPVVIDAREPSKTHPSAKPAKESVVIDEKDTTTVQQTPVPTTKTDADVWEL